MSAPPEFHTLSSHLALWHQFDPAVKAELFSVALTTSQGIILIDPIPLEPEQLARLQERATINGIIVTSQNHWRASEELSRSLGIPVFAHAEAAPENGAPVFTAVTNGDRIHQDLEIIGIPGAAPGEIAVFSELNDGTLVVGDALINFEPYGFSLLPPKYCEDRRQMKRSLTQLGKRRVNQIFFAHGLPIMSEAGARLRSLLDST